MQREHQRRLAAACRRFGGKLQLVERVEYNQQAPFSAYAGVDYEKKIVFCTPTVKVFTVIHEMGHVFASQWPPHQSDEWSFFGWEYALARRLRLAHLWRKGLDDHQIDLHDALGPSYWGRYEDFSALDAKEQREVLRNRLRTARACRLVVGDRPVAIR